MTPPEPLVTATIGDFKDAMRPQLDEDLLMGIVWEGYDRAARQLVDRYSFDLRSVMHQ
jgi:hypothetical protein